MDARESHRPFSLLTPCLLSCAYRPTTRVVPLDCPQPAQRPFVASGILSAFKKLYGDSRGPRLEYILRNALLALLDVPGTSSDA